MLEEFYKSTKLNLMQHLRNKTDTFDKRKKTREQEAEKGKKLVSNLIQSISLNVLFCKKRIVLSDNLNKSNV